VLGLVIDEMLKIQYIFPLLKKEQK
jgi:hypothetical protein